MEKKFYLKINKVSKALDKLDNQVVISDSPLPKDYRIWIISGSKGSGKSTLMLNVLKNKHAYKGFFDNIFLVSPTSTGDKKFEKLLKELDQDGKYYSECSDDTVGEIIDRLKSFKDSFDEREEGRKPHSLVIFDDCLAYLPKSMEKSRFNELITTSRHLKCSVWILVQKYNKVNPLIRAQQDLLSIFHTNNRRELESLEDDLNLDKKQFKEIYEFATDEPNSFLHVSFIGGKPKYYKKFNQILI